MSASHTNFIVVTARQSEAYTDDGKTFFVGFPTPQTVTAGSTLDILFVTPATPYVNLELFAWLSDNGPCDTFMYEGSTVSANGSEITAYNSNRNSSNQAQTKIFSGPTVTGTGTALVYDLLTTTKQTSGTTALPQTKWVLKPSTNYLFRLKNNSLQSATVDFNAFWYQS